MLFTETVLTLPLCTWPLLWPVEALAHVSTASAATRTVRLADHRPSLRLYHIARSTEMSHVLFRLGQNPLLRDCAIFCERRLMRHTVYKVQLNDRCSDSAFGAKRA